MHTGDRLDLSPSLVIGGFIFRSLLSTGVFIHGRGPGNIEPMGHYCRICGRYRPNESFSGRGHRMHVCKKCSQLPREVRSRREALDEIWGFLEQSNISDNNIRRLSLLAESADPEVREMASIVHAIGKAHPGRRRPFKKIRANHPALWQRILEGASLKSGNLKSGPARLSGITQ